MSPTKWVTAGRILMEKKSEELYEQVGITLFLSWKQSLENSQDENVILSYLYRLNSFF